MTHTSKLSTECYMNRHMECSHCECLCHKTETRGPWEKEKQMDDYTKWTFRVEGFGEVGYANLMGFVPFDGFKHPRDLALNEMTEGRATMCGQTDVVRLWRSR